MHVAGGVSGEVVAGWLLVGGDGRPPGGNPVPGRRMVGDLVFEQHDDLIGRARAQQTTNGHVFEMLTPHLPMEAVHVRSREIDTPEDYDRALEWLAPIAHCWA